MVESISSEVLSHSSIRLSISSSVCLIRGGRIVAPKPTRTARAANMTVTTAHGRENLRRTSQETMGSSKYATSLGEILSFRISSKFISIIPALK